MEEATYLQADIAGYTTLLEFDQTFSYLECAHSKVSESECEHYLVLILRMISVPGRSEKEKEKLKDLLLIMAWSYNDPVMSQSSISTTCAVSTIKKTL